MFTLSIGPFHTIFCNEHNKFADVIKVFLYSILRCLFGASATVVWWPIPYEQGVPMVSSTSKDVINEI